MRLGAACAVLLLPLAAACAAQASQGPHGVLVIPLDLTAPRPAVDLTIGDHAPVKAIFDTGALNTVVNIEEAEALGLKNEGPLQPPFDQHFSTGYQSTLRNTKIGPVELDPLSVPVLPPVIPGFAAVFSPNAFMGQLVTLDLASAELRLQPKTSATVPAGAATPYGDPPLNLPMVPIEVEGATHQAVIDTGAPGTILFPQSFAERLKLSGPLKKIGEARSHFGQKPIYESVIDGVVRIGPLELQNPTVRFSDAAPAVLVGGEIIRQLLVIMDPAEQRVWVESKKG